MTLTLSDSTRAPLLADPALIAQLSGLATAWPVGDLVLHRESGWLGRVTPDSMVDLPGAQLHPGLAHCMLLPLLAPTKPSSFVSLVWEDTRDVPAAAGMPAWINTAWLRRPATSVTRLRSRSAGRAVTS